MHRAAARATVYNALPSTYSPKPIMLKAFSTAARARQGRGQYRQRHTVVERVAREVDGIGQQRQRARLRTGQQLDRKHGGISSTSATHSTRR